MTANVIVLKEKGVGPEKCGCGCLVGYVLQRTYGTVGRLFHPNDMDSRVWAPGATREI